MSHDYKPTPEDFARLLINRDGTRPEALRVQLRQLDQIEALSRGRKRIRSVAANFQRDNRKRWWQREYAPLLNFLGFNPPVAEVLLQCAVRESAEYVPA